MLTLKYVRVRNSDSEVSSFREESIIDSFNPLQRSRLTLSSSIVISLVLFVFGVLTATPSIASEPGSFEWVQDRFPAYPEKPAIGNNGMIYTRASSFFGVDQQGEIQFDIDDGIIHRVGGGITVRPDGSVLMADPRSGKIYAYSATGERLWNYDTGGGPEEDWVGKPPNGGYGHLKHIGLAGDGTVYAVTGNSTLFAVSSQGTLKWKTTLHPDGKIYNSAPVINRDGTVLIGLQHPKTVRDTEYLCEGPDECYVNVLDERKVDGGKLYAVNPDGSIQWSYQTDRAIRGSAAIDADGTVYVGDGQGSLYALTQNGSRKWKHTTPKNKRPFQNDPLNGYFYGSASLQMAPAIGTDGTIYYGAHDNKFYAVNPDGSRRWVYQPKQDGRIVGFSPAIGDDGTIYFGNEAYGNRYAYGHIYALNPDGTLKWKRKVHGRARGTPIIYRGSLIYSVKGSGINGGSSSEKEGLVSINVEGTNLSRSPWPSYKFGRRNTGRAQDLCSLKPSLKLRPKRVNLNGGVLTLFITGFDESNTRPSAIKPSSVKLNGAEPERWTATPQFLQLKYRRDELDITLDSRKWSETSLSIEGSLKESGCFSVSHSITARP